MGVSSQQFSPEKCQPDLKKKFGINGPFLLYVGRLTEKKGVSYLIKSMENIVAVMPECKLMIVGSGELDESLRQQVRELNLSENIIFNGAVCNEDMPSYYATADIFISPSLEEGFGLTFVEAAMSDCVLIGSDVGGVGDIIKHEDTGILVPPKDSGAIADAVICCLQSREKMEKLTANSRKYCIRNFDWPVIVEKYTSLLEEIVN